MTPRRHGERASARAGLMVLAAADGEYLGERDAAALGISYGCLVLWKWEGFMGGVWIDSIISSNFLNEFRDWMKIVMRDW